jgi:hypothetical protein
MSVAIRRQVDRDKRKRSVSLLRLLEEIRDHPTVLSRARYRRISRMANTHAPRGLADRGFDRLVGPRQRHVSPKAIDREIRTLEKKTYRLKRFVDKRIAHHDKSRVRRLPTYQELGNAIAYLELLVLRYLTLFRAVHRQNLLPAWTYDWKEIFRHPWIPQEGLDGGSN